MPDASGASQDFILSKTELREAVARLQESLAAFIGQHGAGRRAWHRQTILPGLRGLLESARQVTRQLAATPELCGGVDFGPYPPLSEAAEAVTTRAARWLKACNATGFWLNPRWDETATVRHNGKPVTWLVEGGDFGETLSDLGALSLDIDRAGRAMVAHWQRLDDLQAVEDAMAPCPEAMPTPSAADAPQPGDGNGQDAATAGGTIAAEKPAAGKPARRKRTRRPTLGKPLTDRQREAVEVVGRCGGNVSEAARLLALDPSTVRQHYRAGMEKLGETAIKGTRPKTQAIPTDRRGQEQV